MTPQFSNKAELETLRFGFGDTPLGLILVAEGAHGVVALFMGDERTKLGLELREAFPEAQLLRDDAGLSKTIAKAVALIEAPHLGTDLPLDLRGSPIEVAVWEALRAVPAGETRTYGAIARDLPITATAQEVGAACAANKIAVAIPCHRVVKSDGSIAGYRWGVRRKRRLINTEGVA
jgi:AraC family transcriptional regulator, regulatory protein of adaptative response / methylated-DNA-[protein]-cysteine methyltransferase